MFLHMLSKQDAHKLTYPWHRPCGRSTLFDDRTLAQVTFFNMPMNTHLDTHADDTSTLQ